MLRKVVVSALVVAWTFAVVFAYYLAHKPFSEANAIALLSVAGDLAVFALLFLLGCGLGRMFLRAMTFDSPLEATVIRAGFGWGIISFFIFALGLLGLLNSFVFWAALVTGLILMRNDLRTTIHDLRAIQLPISSRFERVLAIFVAATILLALIRALTPPLAWDAQVYHLTQGKFWIEQGRISAPPDIPYFSFPSLVEMLYLGALLLAQRGDTLAQVIHWGFLLLTLGLCFTFAQKVCSSRVGWIAAAFLSAIPSFVLVAAWPYVDAAVAFYATAALYVVVCAREPHPRLSHSALPPPFHFGPHGPAGSAGDLRLRGLTLSYQGRAENPLMPHWFVLAGAFAGFAVGVKYTAMVVPVALLVLIIRRDRAWVRRALWFVAAVAVVAAPWYLRNLIFQHNPLYPFFLGGPFWDSFRAAQFSRFGSGLLNEPLRLLIAPWEATVVGQEGGLNYEATIGPLLLLATPLLFFARPRGDRTLGALFIFVAVLYGFWLLGVATSKLLLQTRLLFPAFPTLALIGAVAFDRLSELDLPQFSLARFAKLVAVLVLGLTCTAQTLELTQLNPFAYLAGYESRDEYLARRLAPAGYYSAMQSLENLPTTAKVLFLWEPRSYYARGSAQIVPDALLDHFGDLQLHYDDMADMAEALRQEGYTHILLNRAGLNYYLTTQYDPISVSEVTKLQMLLAADFRQVSGHTPFQLTAEGGITSADTDAYALYEILPTASARK